jgi:hypothetical protein
MEKELGNMEWKELTNESKNVLERCWSVHHDRPLTFSVELNNPFSAGHSSTIPTEETYIEILKYQKLNPQFDVTRIDNKLTVRGNCNYGSWFNKEALKG